MSLKRTVDLSARIEPEEIQCFTSLQLEVQRQYLYRQYTDLSAQLHLLVQEVGIPRETLLHGLKSLGNLCLDISVLDEQIRIARINEMENHHK